MIDSARRSQTGSAAVPRHAAQVGESDVAAPGIGLSTTALTGIVVGVGLLALALGLWALVGLSAHLTPPVAPSTVQQAPSGKTAAPAAHAVAPRK